ncbi:hypothetical protein BRC60_03360 [Halobacteriales archaeon QH_1_68_42]|nr:MAG: hypothetical protein BRC60_03360 [Halobacteriales archaeon QH_1_68_42]
MVADRLGVLANAWVHARYLGRARDSGFVVRSPPAWRLIRSVVNQCRISSNRSAKYRYIGTTDRMTRDRAAGTHVFHSLARYRSMAETVEYCLRNVSGETRERLAAEASAGRDADTDDAGGVAVDERRCLQRCGTCYSEAFLVVDGTVAVADSHADLLAAHLPEADR